MLTTMALCVSCRAFAQGPPPGIDLSRDRIYYGVSQAHLDTQWLWTIQDTISKHIPRTLRGNFDLFDRYPHYTFSFEGAIRYMLAKEYYPEDYAKLKRYVADGRWRVAGSTVDSGDTNIVSPESLIRQILYGNGFFRREFGKTSVDIFLPDCFGFGYALPSVAAHCGLKGFSTQKLGGGAAIDLPFDIGAWEGPDGASITAAIRLSDYICDPEMDYTADKEKAGWIEGRGHHDGIFMFYKYFGVGDTGGALAPDKARWLELSASNTEGPVRFLCTGSDQFFRDLTPQQAARLPRYKGELLMTRHGTGCYTTHGEMKRLNRRNEQLGDAAERTAVAADWLGGLPYPTQQLRDSWVRFLWHQFHDDLTGTSIPQAYTFSWNDELLSQSQFAGVLSSSVGAVTRALDTTAAGVPVVIVNPLSIEREDVVTARVRFDGGPPGAVRVVGPTGSEAPSQITERRGKEVEVVFLARVPSVGYAVFDLQPDEALCSMATGLSVSRDTLENSRYRVKIDDNGDVSSVFDKAVGKELLAGPCRLELRTDRPDQFAAWEIRYEDVAAEPLSCVAELVSRRVVENGPARVAVELVRRHAGSVFTQRISLAAGDAGNRLELSTRIDWRTKSALLKAAFPLTASNPSATYDLGLGTVERGNNTPRLYEVPAQQWADLTSKDGSHGVAILNDCKYGWDKPADNLLRLSLLRNPIAENYESTNDIGVHELRYAICGHAGDWRQGGVSWQAARLNQPLIAFQAPKHGGALGRSFSMAQVSTSQVMVKALKKAEDSPRDADAADEIVVRLQELSGRACDNVQVSFAAPVLAAREVRGDEQPLGEAVVTDGRLTLSMTAYQPRTFALRLAAPKTLLAPPACAPVELPYDADVLSSDGQVSGGDIDGKGHAIPRELFPAGLDAEGIGFRLGSTEISGKNALRCRGQQIRLNAEPGARLYLLAASTAGDQEAEFVVDKRRVRLPVRECTGWIGQWNSRAVDGSVRPGFFKPEPVAWVGTHRHDGEGRNEPYVFCYMFKYAIDLPRGARSVTLPNDDRIMLFAATVAENPNDDTVPAQPLVAGPPR